MFIVQIFKADSFFDLSNGYLLCMRVQEDIEKLDMVNINMEFIIFFCNSIISVTHVLYLFFEKECNKNNFDLL